MTDRIRIRNLLKNHRKTWNEVHTKGYGGYSEFDDARMKWVLSMLPKDFLTKESVVLEIGCGSGNWIKKIAPLVRKVYGVDISSEVIKMATNRLKEYDNVEFSINNGCTLDNFNDDTFDLVYSYWTFQHLPREITRSYLWESHRVLKNDGLMLFQVESYDDPALNTGDINHLNGETEQIGYTRKELSDITRDCRLQIIRRGQENFLKYERTYIWSLCEKY